MECLYKHANNHNQFGQKSSELIHNHLSMILNNCLWPASIFPETKIRKFFIIDATDFYGNKAVQLESPNYDYEGLWLKNVPDRIDKKLD